MGIVNRNNALYMATGIDNSGLYSGRREAIGILKAMAGEITSFDVFGGIGISAGIAFASAAKDAYNFEKQFQQSMKEVATLSSGIKGSLTDYMNQIMDLTREVPVQANDAGKALYQIVSAGHDGAKGMNILKVSAKAAIGGVTETATAADAITTVLNAYKLDAGEAENISNQLFTTVRLGKTTFGELGQSIAQAAPIAAAYGVEIDQVLAAVATLTKQGTPTAQAMTQIRAAIVGVSKYLGDGAYNGRTFQEALELVRQQAGGSEAKLREFIPEMEAVNGLLGMTGKNAQAAASDLEQMGSSAGASEAAFKEMVSSAQNQLQLLQNNITAFLRPMGEAILKEVSGIATSFNEAFANGDVQESMRTLGDLIVIVTGALVGYKGSILAVSTAKRIYASITAILNKQRTIEIGKLVLSQGFYDADTAAVVKNTSARVLLTKALKAQFAASVKATGAMLANPYVLAAAAVAGLGYGLYKLATYQSEADKAQIRLNDALKESASFALSEQRELARLKGELSTLAKGTDEYNTVKNKIVSQFGRYYAGLDEEITKVGLTEEAYNKLTLAINKSFGARQYEKFASEQQEELSNIMADNLEKIQERLYSELGDEAGAKIYAKIRESIIQGSLTIGENGLNIQGLGSEIKSALDKVAGKDGGFLDVTNRSVERYISNIIIATKRTDELNDKARKRFGIENTNGSNKKDEKNNEEGGGKKSTYQEDLAKAKADWEKAKKGYEVLLKDQNATSEQVKNARDDMQAKEKAYKDLGGITGSSLTNRDNEAEKLRKEQEKYKLLVNKQELERIRINEDLQMQVDEARINSMDEGSKKTIAQMELNFEKEMQAIDRHKEDTLRKKIEDARSAWEANPENKGKSFDASGIELSDGEQKSFDELYKAAIASNEKEYSNLANLYLSYTDQRLEIEKKFNDDIAVLQEARKKAVKKGDADEVAKINRSIGKRTEVKNEDAFRLDAEQFKKSMNWEQVFGNLDKVSTDTLKKLKANLKDFISAQKDLSPENLKELVDAIERIDEKVSERNPFEAMSVSFKSLKSATDAQREAQEAYNKALKEGTDEEKKNAEDTLESAKNNKRKALVEATTALHKGVDEIGQYVDAGNQVIGIMETLGVKTPEWLGGYMDGVGEMLNGLSNIDLTKPMSIVTGSLQTIKGALTSVISLGGLIPGLSGADYSGYENMKSQYENLISIWDELIDKKMQYIDIDYGKEAMKVAKEAEDATNIQINRQRQLIKQLASSGASKGSHSLGYRIDHRLSKEDYQRLSDLAGQKITAEYQLWDLSPEQIEKILSDEKLVSVLDTVNKDFVTYLQNIVDYGEKLDEITERTKEAVTGISFDEFRSGYAGLLSDLDSTNEDFANNFEKYLQQAIFESLLANEYKDQIQELYDTWAEYGKDGLNSDEAQTLRDMQQKLTNDLLAKRDELMNDFGWESESKSTSQSSTSKGFQTMSQDTGEELNGRFTALQIAGEEIKNQTIIQTGIQGDMLRRLEDIYKFNAESYDEYYDMMLSVIDILDNIYKNTNSLPRMEVMLKEVKEYSKALAGK